MDFTTTNSDAKQSQLHTQINPTSAIDAIDNAPISKALFQTACSVAPGGVHSPVRAFKNVGTHPRFIASALGAYLQDVDGNSYIDFCNAWGALIYGHQDEVVANAMKKAIQRGWVYGMADPYSLELCKIIKDTVPWAERIRLTNSGTEAVMAALRVARAAKNRPKILKFDGCYHGHCDSMLVRAGSGLAEMAVPDSAGVSEAVAGETLVVPLNDLPALEKILQLHAHEIAAVIIEPLPANNGLLIQDVSYLKSVRELCNKYDILLIFDEVISGFRVHLQGMVGISGVVPDIVTYGKVIGGGASIACVVGRSDVMDLIAPQGPVYQAGTYSANGLAVSAALANLQRLISENPYAHLAEKTSTMVAELNSYSNTMGIHWQSFASIFWPVFFDHASQHPEVIRTPDQIPPDQKQKFAQYFRFLLSNSIMLSPSGYEVGFLNMVHGPKEIDHLLTTTRRYCA